MKAKYIVFPFYKYNSRRPYEITINMLSNGYFALDHFVKRFVGLFPSYTTLAYFLKVMFMSSIARSTNFIVYSLIWPS